MKSSSYLISASGCQKSKPPLDALCCVVLCCVVLCCVVLCCVVLCCVVLCCVVLMSCTDACLSTVHGISRDTSVKPDLPEASCTSSASV